MSSRFASRLTAGLFAAAFAFAVGAAPAMAQTTPQGTAQGAAKSATAPANKSTASTKKPGQSCDKLDKATKAYSDCVKAQAQSEKKPKPAETAKTVEKGKKKG